MASIEKFTHEAIVSMLRHNTRTVAEPANTNIDPERQKLNYSFHMNHCGLSDYQYYKKIIDEKYIYGRGTQREKHTVTSCSWVVTAPKEICGDPIKEKNFFQGVFDFVSKRYGKDNIVNNAVHYDESGSPHIHIIFCPVTDLNHDKVRYKTTKTKNVIKKASGRYEYECNYVLKNGTTVPANEYEVKDNIDLRIPLKNYSKMSDYYDEKISANDVLNKIELKNFHYDLQKYLDENDIEGSVITGKTGGINYSVKTLKDFTEKTGLRLDEVKEIQGERSLLEKYVEQNSKIKNLESLLYEKIALIESLQKEIITAKDNYFKLSSDFKAELLNKDAQIQKLTKDISEKDHQIIATTGTNLELQNKIMEMEVALHAKQHELESAYEKINYIEVNKEYNSSSSEFNHDWERNTNTWNDRSHTSGWENRNTEIEEEKTW
ncbi:Plasmid recombination enzyme [Lachnospiraceae bacterium]|nr:Plasmid recombination enzyme [Lachnospiraceae bacterium]